MKCHSNTFLLSVFMLICHFNASFSSLLISTLYYTVHVMDNAVFFLISAPHCFWTLHVGMWILSRCKYISSTHWQSLMQAKLMWLCWGASELSVWLQGEKNVSWTSRLCCVMFFQVSVPSTQTVWQRGCCSFKLVRLWKWKHTYNLHLMQNIEQRQTCTLSD